MLSHARVSRRLSRRTSSNSNSNDNGQSIEIRKLGSSRAPSLFSQAITIQDSDQPDSFNDVASVNNGGNPPINFKNSTCGLYFNSLQELEAWYKSYDDISSNIYDSFRIPRKELNLYKRARPGPDSINLSVCHDFKGNYLNNEDLDPHGYFPHPNGSHYYLQFPSLVSSFIYFSHNMITVPTVSWINNCHSFGIQCLGTIILEGNSTEKFKQLTQLCTKDNNNEFIYVKMLVKLLRHYRFDGFLINIETRFLNHSDSYEIINFIDSLKSAAHLVSRNSKIVWYDSFIPSLNKIKYENGVSPSNYQLFKSSDQFLSNYWWDEDTLKKNVAIAGLHGVKSSLYVGIDMWGRGSKIGNGGYDAPIAINFCKAYDSNVCLFAPAWTYEYLGQDNFLDNDKKLWRYDEDNDTISSHVAPCTATCYHPFAGHRSSHSKKHSFVFYTNFSTGEGKFFSIGGKNVFNNYWVNNNFQSEIPDIVFDGDINKKNNYNLLSIEIDKDEAYIGGSCLKITKNNSLLIMDDGESQEEINKQLADKTLFSFANDCRAENLRVKLNYKYSLINKDFQTMDRDLNSSSDKAISNSLLYNSKSSVHDIVDGYFQLEVRYKIERRYKSTHNVSDGVLKVPLDIANTDISASKSTVLETEWKTLEMTFPTPKGIKWEYCVLESVNISWISSGMATPLSNSVTSAANYNRNHSKLASRSDNDNRMFSNIFKVGDKYRGSGDGAPGDGGNGLVDSTTDSEFFNNDDEEWIVLPDNAVPTSFAELYIGDLAIYSVLDEDLSSLPLSSTNKIKEFSLVQQLSPSSIYVRWNDFTNNLTKASYWNIFVAGEFVGVSYFNYWIVDLKQYESSRVKQLKIRVDSVSVIGDIIKGEEISFKV